MSNIKVILLSGPICSGKSTLCSYFENEYNYKIIKSRDLLLKYADERGYSHDRPSLQALGSRLDEETESKWLLNDLLYILENNYEVDGFILDSVRVEKQLNAIRRSFGRSVVHVHLTAPKEILCERYEFRSRGNQFEYKTYDDAIKDPIESQVYLLESKADLVIDTFITSDKDVPIPVAARLGLLSNPYDRVVDVIVGGQYGSEGKGHICSYLAPEYDVLVRVGGPNAGHTVYLEPNEYTFHQLPSGTIHHSNAKLIIAPGSLINPQRILKEITELEIKPDRLFIDEQAMIITEDDMTSEKALVNNIGSTGQGVGFASARKIIGRSDKNLKLAKDIDILKPFIVNTSEVLEECYRTGQRILVEGTQGTGLSLHHGIYPFVTSRDTSVAGCLSEAGISPSRVNRVIMIIRSYPIRVESPMEASSGPLEREIDWKTIAERSGLELSELEGKERTSTTGRRRRVGEFDWRLFRKSCSLNAPTDIALTFVDYICAENTSARRFEQLSQETMKFIEQLENVARAPVSLINTRFAYRSIIDRRNWF